MVVLFLFLIYLTYSVLFKKDYTEEEDQYYARLKEEREQEELRQRHQRQGIV